MTRGAGRPRDIEAVYQGFATRYDRSPGTRDERARVLRNKWEPFLARRKTSSSDVTIYDWIAFIEELTKDGFSSTDAKDCSLVKGFYKFLAAEDPKSRWREVFKDLDAHPLPHVVGKKHPHKSLPLRVIPRALDAAAHVVQRAGDGDHRLVYNEAPPVVATFVYTGGRAQAYGLRTEQAEQGISDRYVDTFAKENEEVRLIVPDQLRSIWRRHLDARDFDGPALFRHGKDPYTHQDGGQWQEDVKAADRNNEHVEHILRGRWRDDDGRGEANSVEGQLLARHGIDERLTAHRFRKSLGTFMEAFGFLEVERRAQLTHGAKTITQDYSVVDTERLQRKMSSRMDLGSIEWVDREEAWAEAHDGQYRNLFANGEHEVDASIAMELQALRRQVEELTAQNRKLQDALVARVVA